MNVLPPLASALLLTACVAIPPPPLVRLTAPFDAGQAAAQLVPGNNTIEGSALIRQQGGTIVTCAGYEVHLIPATAYARERMAGLYGSLEIGFNVAPITFVPDEPQYWELMKNVTCDAQGMFVFEEVADGTYYVTTNVQWIIANTPQGGALMRRVVLEGGKSEKIVLTPP